MCTADQVPGNSHRAVWWLLCKTICTAAFSSEILKHKIKNIYIKNKIWKRIPENPFPFLLAPFSYFHAGRSQARCPFPLPAELPSRSCLLGHCTQHTQHLHSTQNSHASFNAVVHSVQPLDQVSTCLWKIESKQRSLLVWAVLGTVYLLGINDLLHPARRGTAVPHLCSEQQAKGCSGSAWYIFLPGNASLQGTKIFHVFHCSSPEFYTHSWQSCCCAQFHARSNIGLYSSGLLCLPQWSELYLTCARLLEAPLCSVAANSTSCSDWLCIENCY